MSVSSEGQDATTVSGPAPERLGWDKLEAFFQGAKPEAFPDFVASRPLETTFDFLYHLVGRQPRDLIARAAILRMIQAQPSGAVAPRDMDAIFGGIDEKTRDAILSHLRDGGWIRYTPLRGWFVTALGHRYYQAILFLLKTTTQETLEDSLHMHEALNEMSGDKWASLRGLKANLQSHLADVEAAIATHSSLEMQAHKAKVGRATELSNVVLERLKPHVDDPTAYGIINELHQVSVNLGLSATDLQRNLVQVLKQQITLPSGFTIDDVTRALIMREAPSLASAMTVAYTPPHVPNHFVDLTDWPDGVLAYWDRERLTTSAQWEEPPVAEPSTVTGLGDNKAAREFLVYLQSLPKDRDSWDLDELLRDASSHEAAFRLAVLGLLGRGGTGESLIQQFKALGLEEEIAEGFKDLVEGPVTTISKARVRRRSHA